MRTYRAGFLALTTGSKTIVGIDTAFLANVEIGAVIVCENSQCFEVVSITDDTHLVVDAESKTTGSYQYCAVRFATAVNFRDLSVKIEQFLGDRQVNLGEFTAWQTGVKNGGPNGDGKYPITDRFGNVGLFSCPDALADGYSESVELAETGNLPSINGENAHYMFNGNTIDGWLPYVATSLSLGTDHLIINKTNTEGASAGAYVPIEPIKGTDVILYGKTGCSPGSVVWLLNTNGFKQAGIWFGTATGDATMVTGAISIRAAQPTGDDLVVRVPGTFDFENVLEYALHIDTRYNTLNFWYKSNGVWVFGARVAHVIEPYTHVGTAFSGGAPNGAQINIYHLLVCHPNIIVYGDSISTGAIGFDPNPANAWTNSASIWTTYAGLYPMLRNNLPVLKGTGGWNSSSYVANVASVVNTKAQVTFFHASSNDFNSGISFADRTQKMQQVIDALNLAGQQVVLLNALPGTPAHASNSAGGMRDYCNTWWTNYRYQLKGLGQMLNIARVIEGAEGYQDAALTVPDGIHPNVAGYKKIGERIRWFYSQAVVNNENYQALNANLSSVAKQVGEANKLLMFTGKDTLGQVQTTPFSQGFLATANQTEARSHINAMRSPVFSSIDGTTDLNTLINPGWTSGLVGSANANLPVAGSFFYILVLRYFNSVTQIAFPYGFDSSGTIHWRCKYDANAWLPWRHTVTDADFSSFSLSLVSKTDAASVRSHIDLIKQASLSDATANRVLTTGSFGIGGGSIQAGTSIGNPAGLGINEIKPSGLYAYYTEGNLAGGAANMLETRWGYDPSWSSQLSMNVVTNEILYRSVKNTEPSKTWARLLSGDNVAQAVGANFNVGGGIMEMGENGNGIYFKFYSGALWCIAKFTGYTAATAKFVTWAHAFPAGQIPAVSTSITPAGAWDTRAAWYGDATSGGFYSEAITSPVNIVTMMAVGRWK